MSIPERAIRLRSRDADKLPRIKAPKMPRPSRRSDDWPVEVGSAYFFRTVTYHMVGRVESVRGKFVHLLDAAWVADTERFMNAILEGRLREVEPVGEAWVNMDGVTDFFPWKHPLPLQQQ